MLCFIKSRRSCVLHSESGQTTVEAAFALPVLFFAFALLLQPTVVLYDRCVMQSAAAEACRLQATQSCSEQALKSFVERRLAVLPSLDLFHAAECPWVVTFGGGGLSAPATVSIEGHVKTLPLVGVAATTITRSADDGCALVSCTATSDLSPSWLGEGAGGPGEWVSQWE